MCREKTKIVPFRDSKLTRVFQSFFCGKGRASMVVNINQVASLFDETLQALKYSAIAKQVVVVQEPEPEPEPPKKKACRNRRLDSVLNEQKKLSRETVGWASPGAYNVATYSYRCTIMSVIATFVQPPLRACWRKRRGQPERHCLRTVTKATRKKNR